MNEIAEFTVVSFREFQVDESAGASISRSLFLSLAVIRSIRIPFHFYFHFELALHSSCHVVPERKHEHSSVFSVCLSAVSFSLSFFSFPETQQFNSILPFILSSHYSIFLCLREPEHERVDCPASSRLLLSVSLSVSFSLFLDLFSFQKYNNFILFLLSFWARITQPLPCTRARTRGLPSLFSAVSLSLGMFLFLFFSSQKYNNSIPFLLSFWARITQSLPSRTRARTRGLPSLFSAAAAESGYVLVPGADGATLAIPVIHVELPASSSAPPPAGLSSSVNHRHLSQHIAISSEQG